MGTLLAMVKSEFKLSLRGMDMVIFAVGMPLVVAVILGMIYGKQPAFAGAGFTFFEQSFGALASIGVCAAGVMGLPLVVADYRHKKILKRFHVTPVSPVLILVAQVIVNMFYSLMSLILIYVVSALFFGFQLVGSVLGFLGAYLLVMLSIYSLGMMVAGVAADMKTANLLCVVLYFPMLIFSGATLPYEVMPSALQRVADFMPLTQGIKLLKGAALGMPVENVLAPLVVMVALTAVCITVSVRYFRWE
ncbi:MAG: ABC transporter permease [Firmicutes bacterium]|nr:ABC transporter permease [Bacillota bacterium]